jgi:hypothetical protein
MPPTAHTTITNNCDRSIQLLANALQENAVNGQICAVSSVQGPGLYVKSKAQTKDEREAGYALRLGRWAHFVRAGGDQDFGTSEGIGLGKRSPK